MNLNQFHIFKLKESTNLIKENEIQIVTEKTQNLRLNSPDNDSLIIVNQNIKESLSTSYENKINSNNLIIPESPDEKASLILFNNIELFKNEKKIQNPLIIPESPDITNEREKNCFKATNEMEIVKGVSRQRPIKFTDSSMPVSQNPDHLFVPSITI